MTFYFSNGKYGVIYVNSGVGFLGKRKIEKITLDLHLLSSGYSYLIYQMYVRGVAGIE